MRPLTKNMISELENCHRTLEKNNFCPLTELQSLKGLYSRKLVGVKKYVVNGKEIMGAYLTSSGFDYLNKLRK